MCFKLAYNALHNAKQTIILLIIFINIEYSSLSNLSLLITIIFLNFYCKLIRRLKEY